MHRPARSTTRSYFFWSIFKLPYLETNRWTLPPYNVASALGPSLTGYPPSSVIWEVSTWPREKKLERWAIRGFRRHLMGDFMQGKTDKWERRRHEDQGGPFWRRSSRLPARRLGFPTTCCLVLNKPLACSLETPYTMAERVPYQELFPVPTFWPSLCLFNPLVPFSLWDLSFCLAQCRWHVWPANNDLLTAMSRSLKRMQISNRENMKEWTL